jgi:hypothetical protein
VRAAHFSPDVGELIETLGRHGVRYLLVGGEAVIYHGYPRLTGDVDFFYEQTSDNSTRLFAALEEFWGGSVPAVASARELLEPGVVVQFGRPPHRVDLISAIDGVTFEAAWPHRIEEGIVFDDARSSPLPIIGLADLVRNKRAAGRHKDLDDAERLELILARSTR